MGRAPKSGQKLKNKLQKRPISNDPIQDSHRREFSPPNAVNLLGKREEDVVRKDHCVRGNRVINGQDQPDFVRQWLTWWHEEKSICMAGRTRMNGRGFNAQNLRHTFVRPSQHFGRVPCRWLSVLRGKCLFDVLNPFLLLALYHAGIPIHACGERYSSTLPWFDGFHFWNAPCELMECPPGEIAVPIFGSRRHDQYVWRQEGY